ncbi:acyltransferase [Fodinicola feengrottensis]|uniref:Acyltransferase n=2 Tax=Fodinicola feengrottensis TaxID=435914 RepID=A0ABN2HX61_9ACTN
MLSPVTIGQPPGRCAGSVRNNELMTTTEAPYIHPTASADEGAQIGAGTKVWHLSYVRSGAKVGRDCNLGRNVYVDPGAVVGDRCKIQNNVSVYVGVTLEDEVFVGPSAVFTNDLNPRAAKEDWTVTPTLVRRGATIGGGVTVVCGVEIGEYAFVAAGAVVTKDVEAYRLVVGNPARPVAWVNRDGDVVSRASERPEDGVLKA